MPTPYLIKTVAIPQLLDGTRIIQTKVWCILAENQTEAERVIADLASGAVSISLLDVVIEGRPLVLSFQDEIIKDPNMKLMVQNNGCVMRIN